MGLSNSELNEHYGRPKAIKPVQVQGLLPWRPALADGRGQVVLCHALIADLFVNVCHEAAERSDWVPGRIDSFYPRPFRKYFTVDGGPHKKPKGWRLGDRGTSRHSWGLAFDFFVTPADVWPPGGVWTPDNGVPAGFAAAFEENGFTWGHRWKRTDTPHIEFTSLPPGVVDPGVVERLSSMWKSGDSGVEVEGIQFDLMILGFAVEPSGVFDDATKLAVTGFQGSKGLSVDGIVGPSTRPVLAEAAKSADVDAAYVGVLGRSPDPGGREWAVKILESYHPRRLWKALWDSPEGVRRRSGVKPPTVPDPVEPLDLIEASARKILSAVESSR